MGLPLGGVNPGATPTTFPSSGGGFGNFGNIFGGSTGNIFGNLGFLGLGVLSAILNRPKGKLSKQQKALFAQIQALLGKPVVADPRELAGLLNRSAQIGESARTRTTKNIVGRGLGQSGILGEAIGNIDTQLLPQLQFESQLQALNLAEGRKRQDVGTLLSLLGFTPPQGQSALGAGVGGLAEFLAFLLRANRK